MNHDVMVYGLPAMLQRYRWVLGVMIYGLPAMLQRCRWVVGVRIYEVEYWGSTP